MVVLEKQASMDDEDDFEQQIALEFRQKVQELLTSEVERDQVYAALRIYHDTMSVKQLVEELKFIVNHPKKLSLFDYIRPLIPLKHQKEYDEISPRSPNSRLRVIRLTVKGDGLGFSIRGGAEHGTEIYVSEVIRESQAHNQGLQVGDHIVRVNTYALDRCTHEEALNIIKQRPNVILKVRGVGMLPYKLSARDPVTWKYVEIDKTNPKYQRDVKVFINVIGSSLGCSITSGPPQSPGIFVQGVRSGGLAEEAGLEIGDQIMQSNGTNFTHITHAEAVLCLKSRKQLELAIRKGGGVDLMDMFGDVQSLDTLRPSSMHSATDTLQSQQSGRSRRSSSNLSTTDTLRSRQSEPALRTNRMSGTNISANDSLQSRRSDRSRSNHCQYTNYPTPETRDSSSERVLNNRSRRNSSSSLASSSSGHITIADVHSTESEKRLQGGGDQIPGYGRFVKNRDRESFSKQEKSTKTSEKSRQQQLQEKKILELKNKNKMEAAENRPSALTPRASPDSGQPAQIDNLSSASGSSGYSSEKGVNGKANGHMEAVDDTELAKLFSLTQLSGKEVKNLTYNKDGPLGVALEGGTDSKKHNGRIVVAEIFQSGSIYKYGGLKKGDQLLMVNGRSLLNITLTQAQQVLKEVISGPGNSLTLAVAMQKKDDVTYL